MLKIAIGLCAMAMTALAAPSPAGAQTAPEPDPVEILPLEFSPDGLGGAGGERLNTALSGAQFIAIGEDHGLAGPPLLGRAIARETGALGQLYHVAEIGPMTTQWVRERFEIGGLEGLHTGLDGKPLAIPFLSNVDDAQLAMMFGQGARLWGIDQEFVGAPLILFDALAAMTDDVSMRRELITKRDKDSAALASGRFADSFLSTATESDFASLGRHFAAQPKAMAIVDALAKSAQIYQYYDDGLYALNNEVRADLMREYFMAYYRNAPEPAPRVLLKMGLNHLGRGTTPTRVYDIGSLLPGIAAANGATSLHLAYMPMGGSLRTVNPSVPEGSSVVAYEDKTVAPILAAAGIGLEQIPETGHVLIPIPALRHRIKGKDLAELPAYSRFILLGFDYLVTTRDAKPATAFAVWKN